MSEVTGKHQVTVENTADFTAAFTHQRDHHHVGLRAARDHAEQSRFTDAGAGEKTQTLTAPDRNKGVDGAHSGGKRLGDSLATQRMRRRPGVRSTLLDG